MINVFRRYIVPTTIVFVFCGILAFITTHVQAISLSNERTGIEPAEAGQTAQPKPADCRIV